MKSRGGPPLGVGRRRRLKYWLLKTEPDEYSLADLIADGRAEWDGVTANPAQFQMRQMSEGDHCIIYHSGQERAAVGMARVARGPYADPTDPAGRRVWVDLCDAEPLARRVELSLLRATPSFAESPLLRMSRLSVVPLSQQQYEAILELSRSTSREQ